MSANRNSVEGQVITGITKLSQFLRTAQWRSGSETGLTPTQMQLLRELAAKGPMRIGALAEAIGVAQPTATDAFEALRRHGELGGHATRGEARGRRPTVLR